MDVIRPRFAIGDLAQLPDDGKRYEIVEGDLVVSPSPNRKHQRCVIRLIAFFQKVEDAGHGQVYSAPFDVVLDTDTVVEPDVLFIRTERLYILSEANVQGAPDLIVEVLSNSTRDRDFGVKLHLYARYGVAEYWVVDPEMETVTRFRLTQAGYERSGPFRQEETLQTPILPGHPLAIAELFPK